MHSISVSEDAANSAQVLWDIWTRSGEEPGSSLAVHSHQLGRHDSSTMASQKAAQGSVLWASVLQQLAASIRGNVKSPN